MSLKATIPLPLSAADARIAKEALQILKGADWDALGGTKPGHLPDPGINGFTFEDAFPEGPKPPTDIAEAVAWKVAWDAADRIRKQAYPDSIEQGVLQGTHAEVSDDGLSVQTDSGSEDYVETELEPLAEYCRTVQKWFGLGNIGFKWISAFDAGAMWIPVSPGFPENVSLNTWLGERWEDAHALADKAQALDP